MSDPTFKLSSNIDVNASSSRISSTDIPVIQRLEQAFGTESFTISEAQDVIDDRDSISRLRQARIIILLDKG